MSVPYSGLARVLSYIKGHTKGAGRRQDADEGRKNDRILKAVG